MATITVVLKKNKEKSDGSIPIAIRIIKDRKTVFMQIGHSIKEENWDEENFRAKKSHGSNYKLLNKRIVDKLAEANKALLISEDKSEYVQPSEIKARIKGPNNSYFSIIAQQHLDELQKLNKYDQYHADKARVNYLKKFVGQDKFPISIITPTLLRNFLIDLKTTKKVNECTAMNYLVLIRTIFNKAIRAGLVDSSLYPFGPGKILIKFPETMKIGLSAEEVQLIEELVLVEDSPEWHARNIWLCSFYLAGIRVSDMLRLKWDSFMDGRLFYIMGKNKKIVSLKTPKKVAEIIEQYSYRQLLGTDYIFPYLKAEDEQNKKKFSIRIRQRNKRINQDLKLIAIQCKIKKPLTMHISRHTFGNIAADKIPTQILQKLYRHSDLKTTIGYQGNFIHKEMDDALESVIGA